MIGCALAAAAHNETLLEPLRFSSIAVWETGAVWQLVTYAFVAPPSIGFAIQMLMLYWFGPEVEKFIGRRSFLTLYLALLIVPALFLTAAGATQPLQYQGADHLLFGIFIAFVVIYSRVEIFFLRLTASQLAWILLGIYSLIYLSNHLYIPLVLLWLSSAIAYIGLRAMGVGGGVQWIEDWKEKRAEEAEVRETKKQTARPASQKQKTITQSIDGILEKISKKGISSLSETERESLDKARSALLKRDQNEKTKD
jgi:membrane associated rhomboid family serine protease